MCIYVYILEYSAAAALAVIRVRVRIKEYRKVFFLPWERHNETKNVLSSDVMMVCGEMYVMYVSPEMGFHNPHSYRDGYPLSIRGYVECEWTRAQGELKLYDVIFFPILVYIQIKKGHHHETLILISGREMLNEESEVAGFPI